MKKINVRKILSVFLSMIILLTAFSNGMVYAEDNSSNVTVSISKSKFVYNQKTQMPTVSVKDSNGNALKNNVDFVVVKPEKSYAVGKYYLTVKMQGDYTGSYKKSYTIYPKKTYLKSVEAKIEGFKVVVDAKGTGSSYTEIQYSTDKNFSKNVHTHRMANKYYSKNFTSMGKSKTYYVRVRSYVRVGSKGTILRSGWSSTKKVTTKVLPKNSIKSLKAVEHGFRVGWNKSKSATGCEIQCSTDKNFSCGEMRYVKTTNTTTFRNLSANRKYYVRIRNYLTVNGKKYYSSWSGYRTVTTKRVAKTSVKSISSINYGFKINWKKIKNVNGYQIQYATSSGFKNAKTKTVSKGSTVSTTVKSLPARRKYYVRVRTYKSVNGTKYYSNWSKSVKVSTKGNVKPKDVQKQVNDYIRSKGVKVDSSLNKNNSGWSCELGGTQKFLNSGTSLRNCKEQVDYELAEQGKDISLYCYYSDETFYICYL